MRGSGLASGASPPGPRWPRRVGFDGLWKGIRRKYRGFEAQKCRLWISAFASSRPRWSTVGMLAGICRASHGWGRFRACSPRPPAASQSATLTRRAVEQARGLWTQADASRQGRTRPVPPPIIQRTGGWQPDVERIPGKVSGIWFEKRTRIAAQAVLDNADDGASAGESADDIRDNLRMDPARRIIAFAGASCGCHANLLAGGGRPIRMTAPDGIVVPHSASR